MMKVLRAKRWLAGICFVVCMSVGLGAAAESCGDAYAFCMPLWNDCLATTGDWIGCHQMLDQCILANGCSTLP